ncbi:MAG TPA: hypothetical protein VGK10_12065 [Prolixibacteraceae bacterium]|jgi:hypothetical protein
MSYTYRQIEDTYVVWLDPARQFMQLKAPAFGVLKDWTNQVPEIEIIRNCAHDYKLRMADAWQFVVDVKQQLRSLLSGERADEPLSPCREAIALPDYASFTARYYEINGLNFLFRYSHPELEALIHPGFGYLENQYPRREPDHLLELYYNGQQACLQLDNQKCWSCPDTDLPHFVGLVNMQLLNCIHDRDDDHWMGAVHASAVSAGKGAVLFTAPSGCGKSTFAAMLMHRGYQVLSDDFSPLSRSPSLVYPFPEAISVKDRSLELLQAHFPSLALKTNSLPYQVKEIFLPIAKGMLPAPEPVRAIVFLNYSQEGEQAFSKLPNLEAMDRFLQQLWLTPSAEVAAQFMDWFFQIPCYTLNYSDTTKAINDISNLFQ